MQLRPALLGAFMLASPAIAEAENITGIYTLSNGYQGGVRVYNQTGLDKEMCLQIAENMAYAIDDAREGRVSVSCINWSTNNIVAAQVCAANLSNNGVSCTALDID